MDLDAQLEEIADLCILIAILRKQRAMRVKGRKFTPRAREQWVKLKQKADLIEIVLEAFRASKVDGKPLPATLKRVDRYLLAELRSLRRSPGRPKKPVGLIDEVSVGARVNKALGRPRLVSKEEEEAWILQVLGKKLQLYAKRAFHVGHKKPIIDTLKKLRDEPDPAEALDGIPDAEAISLVKRERAPNAIGNLDTVSLQALRSRFRRAKKDHQALLLQRKSGGYFQDFW